MYVDIFLLKYKPIMFKKKKKKRINYTLGIISPETDKLKL